MTITKIGSAGYLKDSIWAKVKSILGSTYTDSVLGNKTITYVTGFTKDYESYINNLPIVFIESKSRARPQSWEQGGKRKYARTYHVHIVAGGYVDAANNDLMKENLTDQIEFGFDQKVYDLINPYTGAVEGKYNTEASVVYRIAPTNIDDFERHHSEIAIMADVKILNS